MYIHWVNTSRPTRSFLTPLIFCFCRLDNFCSANSCVKVIPVTMAHDAVIPVFLISVIKDPFTAFPVLVIRDLLIPRSCHCDDSGHEVPGSCHGDSCNDDSEHAEFLLC